ncbi:MAG: hypothetical protein Q9191_001555 [Dirinaria sp. TL-2023a]
MPRITRAALRSNAAALSTTDDAAAVPLPTTPHQDREPLSEIAGNTLEPLTEAIICEDEQPRMKGPAKGRKRKGAKRTGHSEAINKSMEVLEDDKQSSTTSAVEDVRETLVNGGSECSSLQVIIQDEHERSSTPAVEAVGGAGASALPGRGEPNKQRAHIIDDSFVQAVDFHSPTKTTPDSLPQNKTHSQVVEKPNTDTHMAEQQSPIKEDSFEEHIVARSPAKPIMRIEDCVDAIDAFEEEIEKIGEQIPNINAPATPVKPSKQSKASEELTEKSGRITAKKPPNVRVDNRRLSERQSQAPSKKSVLTGPRNKRVSSIHKAPFQPVKSSKPPTISTFELPGDAVARKLKEQREQRMQQVENAGTAPKQSVRAQAPKVRSTKPPTRSSFELPGEGIARKLKEQREERLRQQESEVDSRKKDPKSRGVRLSQAANVKSTAINNSRTSLAKADDADNKDARRPGSGSKPATVKRPTSLAPAEASKHNSSLTVAKRKSSAAGYTSARSSLLDRTTSRFSSAAGLQRTGSNGKNAPHTTRGKEVFERTQTAKEEQERMKKDREEAAKKARAEAAERGRIASRQWAEKQKARKSSAEKASGSSVHETVVA